MWTNITNDEPPTPKRGSVSGLNRMAVIFNASKDRRPLETYLKLVKERAPKIEIDVIATQNLPEGLEQAKQIHDNGYDLLVAAGGDGTLLSVVNAAVHRETLLTILPLGTANDYAKAIGIRTVEDAVEVLFEGGVRLADAGRCTYQDFDQKQQKTYFCSTAGAGLLAQNARLEQHRFGVWLKKLLKEGAGPLFAIGSIFATRNVSTNLLVNGVKIQTKMRTLELSKVREAGDFLLTPHASLDNECLDAWMAHHVNWLDTIRIFLQIVANQAAHLDHQNVEYFTSQPNWNRYGITMPTRIEVEPAEPLLVHLNGDLVGQTPAVFEIVPKALKLLVPLAGSHRRSSPIP